MKSLRLLTALSVVLGCGVTEQTATAQPLAADDTGEKALNCYDLSGSVPLSQPLDICDAWRGNPWGALWTRLDDRDVEITSCQEAVELNRVLGAETGLASPGDIAWDVFPTFDQSLGMWVLEWRVVSPSPTGWTIELFRWRWDNMTDQDKAAIDEYLQKVLAHEEGHHNVWGSSMALFRPRYPKNNGTPKTFAKQANLGRWMSEPKNQQALNSWGQQQVTVLATDVLNRVGGNEIGVGYDWVTGHGGLQEAVGGVNTLLEIDCFEMLPESLLEGRVGNPYVAELKLVEADGDPVPNVTWQLVSGSLPEGLTAPPLISGTPSEEGVFPFTVRATTSIGYVDQNYALVVKEPLAFTYLWRLDSTESRATARESVFSEKIYERRYRRNYTQLLADGSAQGISDYIYQYLVRGAPVGAQIDEFGVMTVPHWFEQWSDAGAVLVELPLGQPVQAIFSVEVRASLDTVVSFVDDALVSEGHLSGYSDANISGRIEPNDWPVNTLTVSSAQHEMRFSHPGEVEYELATTGEGVSYTLTATDTRVPTALSFVSCSPASTSRPPCGANYQGTIPAGDWEYVTFKASLGNNSKYEEFSANGTFVLTVSEVQP